MDIQGAYKPNKQEQAIPDGIQKTKRKLIQIRNKSLNTKCILVSFIQMATVSYIQVTECIR